MSEEKANQTERISFKAQDLKAFFPKNYTQKQMSDTILKLLYDYNRNAEAVMKGKVAIWRKLRFIRITKSYMLCRLRR